MPSSHFSDSLVAINIFNNCHRPGRYLSPGSFASAIGHVVSDSIRHDTHTLTHVSAHQDQPGNELVDSLGRADAFADFSFASINSDLVSL